MRILLTRYLPSLCAVSLTLASAGALATKTTRYLEPTSVGGNVRDPEMEAAERHARETFDQFLVRLRARTEADLEFAVRLRFHDDEGREEHLWVVDVREQRGALIGVVDSQPRRLRGVWVGKPVKIAAYDISDWMIIVRTLHGERRIGGFTQAVLEAREKNGIPSDVLGGTAPTM